MDTMFLVHQAISCQRPLFVDVRHHGSVVCGYHHFLVGALVPEVLEGKEFCLEFEQVYV